MFDRTRQALDRISQDPKVNPGDIKDSFDYYGKTGKVPLHLLVNDDAISGFLAGLLASRRLGRQGRGLVMKLGPELKNALLLFPRLGLFPLWQKRGESYVLHFSPTESQKLLGLELVSEPEETSSAARIPLETHVHRDLEVIEAILGRERLEPNEVSPQAYAGLRNWKKGINVPIAAMKLAHHYQLALNAGYRTDHLEKWPLALKLGLKALWKRAAQKNR